MILSPVLKIYPHKQLLAEVLARDFTALAENILTAKGEVSIALSGGSTPDLFFKAIAELQPALDWKAFRFFWVDERCVPPDHPESNFGSAYREFLLPLSVPEESWFRIRGEDDPQEEAIRYERLVREHVPPGNEWPAFDIVFLGMGTDGHTASVFPAERHLWESESLCTVGTHPVSGQKRITFTGHLINAARHVIFLVTGKEKSHIAEQVIRRTGDYNKYPASLANPVDGELIWYLDSAAAGSLHE